VFQVVLKKCKQKPAVTSDIFDLFYPDSYNTSCGHIKNKEFILNKRRCFWQHRIHMGKAASGLVKLFMNGKRNMSHHWRSLAHEPISDFKPKEHTFHDPEGPNHAHIKHCLLITVDDRSGFQLILTLSYKNDTTLTCIHHLTFLGRCVLKEHSKICHVSIVKHI